MLKRNPLKRTTVRKPLRRVSLKRQRIMRKAGPWRDQYLAEHLACQFLGCVRLADDVHEIARGSGGRARSLMEPAALLTLCREHHEIVQLWSPVQQLCLKKIVAPEEYCLETVNRLRGRAAGAIDEADIRNEMRNI